MDIPRTAMVGMGTCLGLYLGGYNLFESDDQPDLAGALFMCLLVLLADHMRINARVLNRVWTFAVALGGYYVISQVAMFYVWLPFWTQVESVVEWTSESEVVYNIYEEFPRVVVFVRRHMLPICKLVLMFCVTYKMLVLGPVCRNVSGIHEEALANLLAAHSPRSSRTRARRPNKN